MRAQDDNLSFIEVEHGLGELPALVDVRVKSLSEPNRDFIFKGVGELNCLCKTKTLSRERSGSVVECLTRDRGAAVSSLTGVTALCP